jgi:hydrogenase expression/formation protein HypE
VTLTAEQAAALTTCPIPHARYERVMMAHGGGGQLTADLLRSVFLPRFSNPVLDAMEDQGVVALDHGPSGLKTGVRVAVTTDSFVVRPLFFPGGDIGSLAVHGTVNDLAVGGAEPVALAAAFILEEGLPIDTLERVVESMAHACREVGVDLATGDTKVVERGKADGMYITTTGVGVVPPERTLSASLAQPGDRVIVSGTIGDHGMAIMSVREGLEFETELRSDSAALIGLTRAMLAACPSIRCMRDPTRGGLSSALNEIASASRVGIRLQEDAIPVRVETRAACEMLGLDPLYVACEGRLVAVVPARDMDALLRTMHEHPLGRDAALIGEVTATHEGMVSMESLVGGERIVTMMSGEQLPRIC